MVYLPYQNKIEWRPEPVYGSSLCQVLGKYLQIERMEEWINECPHDNESKNSADIVNELCCLYYLIPGCASCILSAQGELNESCWLLEMRSLGMGS